MTWVDEWRAVVGTEPADRTSREVSIQDVLAELILGRRAAFFEANTSTADGRRFLRSIWATAFGDEAGGDVDWFVNEHHLPVPDEWRAAIGVSYCCPDLAAGSDDAVLIVELKTERGSYRRRQASDYLRVARRQHPSATIDLVLLGPTRPGGDPPLGDRQRYAELTWHDVPILLAKAFPASTRAAALTEFLHTQPDLVAPRAAAATEGRVDCTPIDPMQSGTQTADRVEAAVHHALAMAPTVAGAVPGDNADRAIDVSFASDEEARAAQQAIKDALDAAEVESLVGVWLWRPSSGGVPASPAGRAVGRELRLHPKRG